MFAVARCGSAFSAWPPLTIVATQVVPIWPTIDGIGGQRRDRCLVRRIGGEGAHRRADFGLRLQLRGRDEIGAGQVVDLRA